MKYVAIFMVVLVIAAAGLGAYTYANARLQVVSVELKTAAGGERVQEFTALQTAVDRGALNGTAFTESVPGTAADYSFFTYTFRLRNGGLIDAEMVEIQPIPANGDVLDYATADASQVNTNTIVSAGGERDVWSVVLTSAQNQTDRQVSRSFKITYYIWGIPMSVTAKYN